MNSSYPAGNLFVPATHGRLEAIYRPKSNQAERVALVLHPHPQHGGTMHNKVVFRGEGYNLKAARDTAVQLSGMGGAGRVR